MFWGLFSILLFWNLRNLLYLICDRRIVSYELSEHNDNPLVFKTFDKAVRENPDAHPLFHSDRGFQYTSRAFRHKLVQAGMTKSMSRWRIALITARWRASGAF